MAAVAGVQKQKKFSSVDYSKNILQSFIILHVASLGITLSSEPTIS